MSNILEKTEAELSKLQFQKQICMDALKEYSNNHPFEVTAFEKEKIEKVVNRMFDAELDYLERNPEEYFEIYADEL